MRSGSVLGFQYQALLVKWVTVIGFTCFPPLGTDWGRSPVWMGAVCGAWHAADGCHGRKTQSATQGCGTKKPGGRRNACPSQPAERGGMFAVRMASSMRCALLWPSFPHPLRRIGVRGSLKMGSSGVGGAGREPFGGDQGGGEFRAQNPRRSGDHRRGPTGGISRFPIPGRVARRWLWIPCRSRHFPRR